jgi:predicted nucleotidyltransferase
MVAETDHVIALVQRYLQELRAHGIRVKRAFLFGSHARREARAESDIDLAVVSEAFTGDRFADRRRIVPLRRAIDSRIEPFPFDPGTFSRGGILVDEIKRTGVIIPLT